MNVQQKNPTEKSDATMAPVSGKNGCREVVVAILLVMCVAVVGFWEFMAGRSREGFDPFQLTAEDFRDFNPVFKDWSVRALEVNSNSVEPNIIAYRLESKNRRLAGMSGSLVRLVHGYNICDCMRLKKYQVELLHDSRQLDTGEGNGEPPSGNELAPPQLQTWKLTSSTGHVSIWVTSMIRAYDMTETALDTRAMAFPRVNVPDTQGWFPRGFTWRSLRHPIRDSRRFLRSKWNASRCDWLAFLGLRKPAWASEEVLTLVASSHGRSVPYELIDEVIVGVAEAHQAMYQEILRWQASRSSPEDN